MTNDEGTSPLLWFLRRAVKVVRISDFVILSSLAIAH
jgi:hypothetical protein